MKTTERGILIPENKQDVASVLDHTLLDAFATAEKFRTFVAHGIRHQCHTICVFPGRIRLVRDLLRTARVDTVGICAVISFPHGSDLTSSKAEAARRAVGEGASEIDMVANPGVARINT